MSRAAALLGAAAILLSAHPAGAAGRIMKVANRTVVPIAQVIREIGPSRVVFIGEAHSFKEHHRAQLDIIEALRARGKEVAIGLEMFEARNQDQLDRWSAGRTPLPAFVEEYYRNWDFPWSAYREVFLYARDNRLPMVGLNAPEEVTAKVGREGFDSLTGEELSLIPGVTCTIDEEYRSFIRRAFGAHPPGKRAFDNFCEAQMIWDSFMAKEIAAYLDKEPGRTLVVLAGQGHAWKRGIPEQLRRLSGGKIPFTVILPEFPGEFEPHTVLPGDADYLWLDLVPGRR